jgi:hypothetical protein
VPGSAAIGPRLFGLFVVQLIGARGGFTMVEGRPP